MRILLGTIIMKVVRMLEVRLPLAVLRCVLMPVILPLAWRDGRDLRRHAKLAAGWQALGIPPLSRHVLFRSMVSFHLDRFLNFWPDRLRLARWRERISFQGLATVRAAVQKKQPVVFVSLHHGPVYLLRYVLRAVDIPCAMLVLESRAERSPLKEQKDNLSAPAEVPNVFCRDELIDARRFLQNGGCLLLAVDYGRGKLCETGFGKASIQVAKGAFRLAAATGAAVFPVSITECGPWRYEVVFTGKIAGDDWPETKAQTAMAALADRVLAAPEQMQTQLADCLSARKQTVASRIN